MPRARRPRARSRSPLADHVRRLRRERGWTQEELADKTGKLKPRTIQRVEQGRQRPSLDTCHQLAAVFDVDVSDLTKLLPLSAAPDPGRDAIDEYVGNLVRTRSAPLRDLVHLADVRGRDIHASILEAIGAGQHALITGPAGTGKSHTAIHVLLRAAEQGFVPVRALAKYFQGDATRWLDEAVAAHTLHPFAALVDEALRGDRSIVLLCDGLNECFDAREKLPGSACQKLTTRRADAVSRSAFDRRSDPTPARQRWSAATAG